MSWLAEKYIGLLSSQLSLFKRVQSGLYNFRCPDKHPFCGDSKKNKSKARGYLYSNHGEYRYHCHNCGVDFSFYRFLKLLDPDLARQYSFEKFKGSQTNSNLEKLEKAHPGSEPGLAPGEGKLLDKIMVRLDTLPGNHAGVQYVKNRKIPDSQWKYLYYLDDASKIGQISPKYEGRIKGHEARLVIPAFSKDGHLLGLTARAIGPVDYRIKYISISLSNDQILYGLDRYDINRTVYVVEGPLDSLFLDNAIAVGTSSLYRAKPYIDVSRDILVPDNQPRNREVVSIVEKCLKEGFRVVIWPSNIKEKDINDMVLSGTDVQKVIDQNAVSGLIGLTKFSAWKKV